MNWLDFGKGFKTFAGGLVLIGGGAAGMVFGVIDPGTGVMLIGNGLGLWGIGGKAQNIADTIEKWAADKPGKEIKIELPKE